MSTEIDDTVISSPSRNSVVLNRLHSRLHPHSREDDEEPQALHNVSVCESQFSVRNLEPICMTASQKTVLLKMAGNESYIFPEERIDRRGRLCGMPFCSFRSISYKICSTMWASEYGVLLVPYPVSKILRYASY